MIIKMTQVSSILTVFLTYELQVTTYYTSYKSNSSYKLRVTIYCKSWDFSTTPAIHFFARVFKNQVILVSYSWTNNFMNEWSNINF